MKLCLLAAFAPAMVTAQGLTPVQSVIREADILWAIQQFGNSLVTFCWRRSYGRGAGTPLGCAPGLVEDAALCYPPCRDGYHGAAFLCWADCPAGFRDTGVDCLKPPAYGRGAGYVLWDRGDCEAAHPQGCEKWGLMWYPMCSDGFHPVGCCICSPDCPTGFDDIGVSCQRPTYNRGDGTPITTCDPPLERDAALCYPACDDGFDGVGPVCWSECGATLPTNCAAGCATTEAACGKSIFTMIESVFKMALDIVEAAFSDGAEAVAKAALKGAIESAVEFGVRAAANEIERAEAAQHLQAAAQQAHDKLVSTYSATLTPILQARWPSDPSMPAAIISNAAWHVAYASVSSNQYNLVDFIEAVAPFNIGGVIKAFDKPLCSIDIPPQSCSEVPSVCENGGQCSGIWSCQCAPGFTGPTCNVSTGANTLAPDYNQALYEGTSAQAAGGSSPGTASESSSSLQPGVVIAAAVAMVVLLTAIVALAHKRSTRAGTRNFSLKDDSLTTGLMMD